jgi:hypothetical protein
MPGPPGGAHPRRRRVGVMLTFAVLQFVGVRQTPRPACGGGP